MESCDSEEQTYDIALDISGETCPMTFVRTRLALDRMQPGQILRVLVRGAEPLRNVPRTAAEQGHAVLGQQALPDGDVLLWIRKRA